MTNNERSSTIHTSRDISVLVVDDEPGLLEVTRVYLEDMGGFVIDIAQSASGAREMLGTSQYDAIISDYEMPEENGISLLRSVKKDYPNVIFILFTGKGKYEVQEEALDEGADHYLQKGDPVLNFAEIANFIREHC